MRPQKGKIKLFDAAIHLFESQGYFATTVEQIAADAGVSKGLAYHYFKSKEELLAGLIVHATEKIESVAETLVPGFTIEDSLSVFVDNYFLFLQSEKRFLKLQLTLMLMPELRDIVKIPVEQRAAFLLNFLGGWFEDAGVVDPLTKARILLAMLDGVALHYLAIYDQYPLGTMRSQLIESAHDLCQNKINV